MKTVIITVTDSEGTVLDRQSVEIEETVCAIAYRPIKTQIAARGDETELGIGDANKLP